MVSSPEVEAYVAAVPEATRPRFEQLLRIVRECTGGELVETISYGLPTFRREDRPTGRAALHVGGYAGHVSVHPVPDTTADPGLAERVAPYVAGRGTVRIPNGSALPEDLLREVVAALVTR